MALELLADVSWKATLVLALAWGGTRLLLDRSSATIRHAVWALALAMIVGLPLVVAIGPTWPVGVVPVVWRAAGVDEAPGGVMPGERTGWQGVPPTVTRDNVAATGTPVVAARTVVGHAPIPWSLLLVGAWGVGVLVRLSRLGLGLLWVSRLARSAHHTTAEGWGEVRRHAADAIGVAHHVPVALTPRVSVPVTCGLVRPIVLLPWIARQWSPERRTVVLLHELAHVKRRDCLV